MADYLLEKLKQYGASDFYPLHMPGHKRRTGCLGDPFAIDITEIDGFDNLHHAQGILLEAQRRAARLYGAEETYYLVNGSTCGILAAVASQTRRGGRILMARNCHKSVYHAVFLNGLRAAYLYPPVSAGNCMCGADRPVSAGHCAGGADRPTGAGDQADGKAAVSGICGSIRPEDVEDALRRDPGIRTVLITSPTYDGVVSDVRAIAEAAHRAGTVLIVDEAHGAHFGMHPYFPERALSCGADIVINSLHKTLPSLTQTALLHVQGERADRARLRNYLGIYQSSSPSYVLMAGMDACVRLLTEQGEELFDAFAARVERLRDGLQGLRVLQLIGAESFPPGEFPAAAEPVRGCGRPNDADQQSVCSPFLYDFDRSRILISTARSALTGPALAGILRDRYHLESEMAAADYVTAIMTVADTQEGFDRLAAALSEIDAGLMRQAEAVSRGEPANESDTKKGRDAGVAGRTLAAACRGSWPVNEEVLSMQEAEEYPSERIALADSAGRVSAEYVYLYPPGIPLLVPGERISEELLDRLQAEKAAGLELQGMADHAGAFIQAVRHG